jgi:hypothetical protein
MLAGLKTAKIRETFVLRLLNYHSICRDCLLQIDLSK